MQSQREQCTLHCCRCDGEVRPVHFLPSPRSSVLASRLHLVPGHRIWLHASQRVHAAGLASCSRSARPRAWRAWRWPEWRAEGPWDRRECRGQFTVFIPPYPRGDIATAHTCLLYFLSMLYRLLTIVSVEPGSRRPGSRAVHAVAAAAGLSPVAPACDLLVFDTVGLFQHV